MKTYKCVFIDRPGEEKVQASSHREAYEKFLKAHGIQEFPVLVWLGFGDQGKIFRDHLKTVKEKNTEWELERSQKAAEAKKTNERVAQEKTSELDQALSTKTKCSTYLELHPDTRIHMSKYIDRLIQESEKRGLEPAEIKFIHAWFNVEDRSLGESLIARRFAATPETNSTLTPTDMLLKELIVKQDKTNQWLLRIWRVGLTIGFILIIWNLKVFNKISF